MYKDTIVATSGIYKKSKIKLDWIKKINIFKLMLNFILLSVSGFILLVISSIFFRSTFREIMRVLWDTSVITAFLTTIISLVISLMIIIVLGIPTAYILATKKGRIYSLLDTITELPLVFPPAIVGLGLLMAFGGNSIFNIGVPFTFFALIFVQVFVTLPLFIQFAKEGFKDIPNEINEAALVAGANRRERLTYIYIPITIRHLMTGLIMSFLRASGEFGATIMFAGNISGRTQTVSTAIYTYSQSNTTAAVSLAVLHLIIFILPILFLKVKLKYDE
ncbi:MAG: molybdate ABC transporter permease subunit [Fusobacteriota bacterium]